MDGTVGRVPRVMVVVVVVVLLSKVWLVVVGGSNKSGEMVVLVLLWPGVTVTVGGRGIFSTLEKREVTRGEVTVEARGDEMPTVDSSGQATGV